LRQARATFKRTGVLLRLRHQKRAAAPGFSDGGRVQQTRVLPVPSKMAIGGNAMDRRNEAAPDTHRRANGGAQRFIPIVTALQQEAIEFAQRVAIEQDASGLDRHLYQKQAVRRTRRVMWQLSITTRDLYNAAGLHHQDADERYEELSASAAAIAECNRQGARSGLTADH